uniref:Uncharacterized protein n=1 Tax=Ciona intestinalis TaxID=7719 RepID=H2XV71_CIOIN
MYDVIYKYMESTFTSEFHYVQSWFAMTYDGNATITQSNGRPGYNGDWAYNFPNTGDPTWTSVGIRVGMQPHTRGHGGMWNWAPTAAGSTQAPLCVYNTTTD